MKTVRVPSGKTVMVDVAIFSGWVAIFAPIVLEVSENGKSLGTTEVNRIMLPPGPHELTLVNRDLGYKAVQEVTVDAGEVRSITLEPKGTVNFNAVPWAEVWRTARSSATRRSPTCACRSACVSSSSSIRSTAKRRSP